VSDGYFVSQCTPLCGLTHKIGFHFAPRLNGPVGRFELFGNGYAYPDVSYQEFQSHLETTFGAPMVTFPRATFMGFFCLLIPAPVIARLLFVSQGPHRIDRGCAPGRKQYCNRRIQQNDTHTDQIGRYSGGWRILQQVPDSPHQETLMTPCIEGKVFNAPCRRLPKMVLRRSLFAAILPGPRRNSFAAAVLILFLVIRNSVFAQRILHRHGRPRILHPPMQQAPAETRVSAPQP
jgi:hypothetical protein